jgi:hypothetical protein
VKRFKWRQIDEPWRFMAAEIHRDWQTTDVDPQIRLWTIVK